MHKDCGGAYRLSSEMMARFHKAVVFALEKPVSDSAHVPLLLPHKNPVRAAQLRDSLLYTTERCHVTAHSSSSRLTRGIGCVRRAARPCSRMLAISSADGRGGSLQERSDGGVHGSANDCAGTTTGADGS